MAAARARACVEGFTLSDVDWRLSPTRFVQYVADVHLFALPGLAMFAS